jgi:hypothetical protein
MLIQNVLKRIFVPKDVEVIEEYRKLYADNELLHNLYSSCYVIQVIREKEMDVTCSTLERV